MDINLLKDTTQPEAANKPKPRIPSDPELTNPKKEAAADAEPKLPSRFGTWLRSLGNEEKKESEADASIPDKPMKSPNIPNFQEKNVPSTEDIFSDLDIPAGAPDPTPDLGMTENPIDPKSMPPQKPEKKQIPEPVKTPHFPAATVSAPKRSKKQAPPATNIRVSDPKGGGADRSFLVNLLPSEFQQSIDPKSKLISLGLTILITALLVGGAYAALTLYRTSILEQIQDLRSERSVVEQTISDLRPEQRQAIATRDRTELIQTLLDQHVYWTSFFEKLEKYTIDDVYYVGAFNGSLGGQITLSAIGTSFSAPARQLIAFQQASDFLSDVRITSARSSEGTPGDTTVGSTGAPQIAFSVTLDLLPELFYYDAANFPLDRIDPTTIPLPGDELLQPRSANPPIAQNGNTNSGATNTNQSSVNTNLSQ